MGNNEDENNEKYDYMSSHDIKTKNIKLYSDRFRKVLLNYLKKNFYSAKLVALNENSILIYDASKKFSKEHTDKLVLFVDTKGVFFEGSLYQIVNSNIELLMVDDKIKTLPFSLEGDIVESRKYKDLLKLYYDSSRERAVKTDDVLVFDSNLRSSFSKSDRGNFVVCLDGSDNIFLDGVINNIFTLKNSGVIEIIKNEGVLSSLKFNLEGCFRSVGKYSDYFSSGD